MRMETKLAAAYIDRSLSDDSTVTMDTQVCTSQIGRGQIMAISGGRVLRTDQGVYLPVGRGYWVAVQLAADDTYVVTRVLYRQKTGKVKQQWRNVYAEQLGEVAYAASLFDN